MKSYCVLAYYIFTPIAIPEKEVFNHKAFFKDKDIKGRIYISSEGINGQMSASVEDGEKYMQWLKSDPRFANVEFKIHASDEHAFPRACVKLKKQLVAIDRPVDISLTGEHVSPERWKEMLENRDEDTILIDVRNAYEWKVGHFEGAELPDLETFREFPEYAQSLKTTKDPHKTKVMMYCTGGIRCELYSALLKQEGFENVYQLDGGVIKYGLQEGSKHWLGKLFVFDDRISVPISADETPVAISCCSLCNKASDLYYNCANMDCNNLFIACLDCACAHAGCCSLKCQEAPRLRIFEKTDKPRPFKRAHLTKSAADPA